MHILYQGYYCIAIYYMYTYIGFRSCLFVCAPFGQTLKDFAEEGRPVTLVEVWTQSEHCVERGRNSKSFSAAADKTVNRRFYVRHYFVFIAIYYASYIYITSDQFSARPHLLPALEIWFEVRRPQSMRVVDVAADFLPLAVDISNKNYRGQLSVAH